MIKVLLVAPAIAPVIGGAETIAEVLSLGLASHPDIDLRLLVGNRPSRAVENALGDPDRITVHMDDAVSTDGNVDWERSTFARAEHLHRLISHHPVDLIHAMSHDTAIAASIAVADLSGSDRPATVATLSEMSTEHSSFGRARSRFVYGLPITGMLHLSRYYRDVAASHGARVDDHVVTAGVDDRLFLSGNRDDGRRALGAAPDDLVLICPARYSRRKGQLDLIDALSRLDTGLQRRILLVCAGSTNSASSDFLAELRAAAAGTQIRIRFESIGRPDMPDAVAGSDLVVLPSHFEGLGFAAIEAMIAGRAVVLTDVTGFDEITSRPDQAVYVPPNDPAALAQAIGAVLSDRDRRERIALAGHRHAMSQYASGPFITGVVDYYGSVLGTTGG